MNRNALRRYCSLCLLTLFFGFSGCSSVSRLNSPEETPPSGESAGQIMPAQQQQAANPSGGVEIVPAAPTALSGKLQQISTELRMISQELKQITEILRYMSGAVPGTISRPPSSPQIPETIRPVFPSDTTAARLRPSFQSALAEANTAVEEGLSGGMTIVPELEKEPEPAMPTASYQLMISSVERSDLADIMGGMPDISSDNSGNLIYADSFVTFVWTIEPRDISVTFTNNSIDTLTILWKDAGFIDENNKRYPVIHEKITYKNTETEQKPTILMPNEKVSDVLYPADYLIFNKSTGWLQYPIMPYTAFDLRTKTRVTDEKFSALVDEYVGTSFQIAVPIQFHEELFEYLFTFEVEDSFVSIGQQ